MSDGAEDRPGPPDADQLMVIRELPGYAPQIGRLVSWMHSIRHRTLETVRGLTTAELDYFADARGNSIGMLLAHMAAVERAFHVYTFESKPLSKPFLERWGAALNLGDRGRAEIRGRALEPYLETLAEVRASTLAELARRDEAWFARVGPWDDRSVANNAFAWYHVVEDEIHHRGQICLILGLLRPR